MPELTYKQKQEYCNKYFKEHQLSFGNEMANERAEEMFIHAMTIREDLYTHALNEFQASWLIILRATWDEQYKYLKEKIEQKASG